MRTRWSLIAVALTCLALAIWLPGRSRLDDARGADERLVPQQRISAPGRLEGVGDIVQVGAANSGIVAEVLVEEGRPIKRGDVLARLECGEHVAEHRLRSAELEVARAVHLRLKNGPRSEDIAVAEADLRVAEARSAEADESHRRSKLLQQRAVSSVAQLYAAERDASVARAQVEAAKQKLAMMQAGTRPEEIAEAVARVDATLAALALAAVRVSQCEVKSPIDGTVLRKFVSSGELVSQFIARPLFSIADTSRAKVRAEIDERDALRVRIGSRAEVVLHGAATSRISGSVAFVGRSMGRRSVLTGDPAEKSDKDVLEAIIALEAVDVALPVGLRVAVIIDVTARP